MKRVAGWVSVALGVLIAALGAALMVMLGPDNRVTTGPHSIETSGSVVVTAPRLITWTGVQIDVLAELPAQKPVFVGLGNTVDVESLVGETSRLEITEFDTPWKPTIRQLDGRPVVQGAPTALDWWYADAAGIGGASISTILPDEPVSVAVVSVGASNLSGLQVTLAYGIKGGFMKGVGLLLVGIGGVLGGWVLLRQSGPESDDDGAVVYVIVDEDGIERELTAEEVEAGGYDVVDEDEVVVDPEPEPEPERVIYVYVDDDGVEHEVSADEDAEPTEEGESR